MAIQTTYTGQNSGAAPIYTGSKTESAISKGIGQMLQAKQQDVQYMQKEADEFQQAMAIDPIQVTDIQVMNKQAEKLKGFQSRWANVLREREGRLTENDKALMAADMRGISSWQGNIQAKQQAYLQDVQQFDLSKHDPAVLVAATRKVTNGGLEQYVQGEALDIKAASYAEYMNVVAKRAKSRHVTEPVVDPATGMVTYTKKSRWEHKDAQMDFMQTVLSDHGYRKRISEDFAALPRIVKEEWIRKAEAENDGVFDSDVQRNPILEFAWDRDAKKEYLLDPTAVRVSGTGGTKDADLLTMNISALISEKKGISAEESDTGHGWSVGDKAITFTSKATTPKERGVWISASDIGKLPKNATVSGGQVYARPDQIRKDGTVVWNVAGKDMKEIKGEEAKEIARLKMELGRDADNLVEKDGKIYEIIGKEELGIEATSEWEQSKDRLTALFPRIDEAWDLLVTQGWGTKEALKTTDGKINIMGL